MTMFLAPYTAIADIDGNPLDAGFLFFGEYGKDPELFPIEVFWDADFTIPAAQPIRTRNGYPVRNGSPAKIYLREPMHSISVKNRNGSTIFVDVNGAGLVSTLLVRPNGETVEQSFNDVDASLEEKQQQIDRKASLEYVGEQLDLKAPQATTYTKSEVDSALSLKAPQATTYTKSEVDTTFAAYAGGRKAYTTLASAQAAQSSLPANTAIEVTNDPTSSNNGTYQWNGTTLTKSAYDPLSQAKLYTDEKNNENNPNLLGVSLTGLTVKTLDASEAKYKILFLSGALDGDCTVNFPKQHGIWEVRHQATGGDILLKTLDSALTPIRISNGQLVTVLSDGTNLLVTNSHKVNANGGALTNATANTPNASTSLGVANVQFSNRLSHGATYIGLTADKVLSADEASYKSIIFTGALIADTTVEFPVGMGQWIVSNSTTGGFKLSLKCTGQASTPITLADNGYYNISAAGSTIRFTETLNQTKTAPISLTGLSEKTLTVEEARNDVIFIGGTLTQDTVVNFPKLKGAWSVRHQATAGFKLLLKVTDSSEAAIEITNGQFVYVVGDQINLYLVDRQNQNGVHRGAFKDRETYNMNDVFEHGSGTYKTVATVATNSVNPIDNYRFKKIGNKSINNKTISVVSESAQAINGTTVRRIMSASKDGSTVYSNQPYAQITESKDFGQTWTKVADIAGAEASLIEQMDDGELIIYVTESAPATTNLVRRIYTTVGYGTDNVQLVSRLMSQRDKCYFGGQWGFDMYKNIILATEYGAKYKPDADVNDASWVNVVGGNSRYVWLSLDYGKTWKVVFDLNSKTDGIGIHMHSAVYDYVWNRIWVHHGDGATGRNGMYYSDDLGATWTYALQNNAAGANFPQATCTVVLPDCILFGSDSAPNGVYRLDRSQGKQPYKGYYQLETAWKHPETSDTVLNAVCYKIAHTKHIPDAPYIFAFAPESNPTKGVIVATFDGYSFFQLWQDSQTRGVGYGVRHVAGVTLQNEIIADVMDDRFGAGVRTELRIKV